MNPFRHRKPTPSPNPAETVVDRDEGEPGQTHPNQPEAREGERGIPWIHRARSLQSRVSNVLAIGLMAIVGMGLMGWYYGRAFSQPTRARSEAQVAMQNKAQGEMPLPALGPVSMPISNNSAAQGSAFAAVLGPAPEEPPPDDVPDAWLEPARDLPPMSDAVQTTGAMPPGGKSPAALALERKLSGPVYVDRTQGGSGVGAPSTATPYIESAAGNVSGEFDGEASGALGESRMAAGAGGQGVEGWLKPSVTPAVRAKVLPTQRLLLPKGAFIDCTLETAIDSTLPGMTTCITATDTFSVDGKVVLLERGTKLVGETRGQVQQGSSRVFVLWTEARTPTGVMVPLASPGTDELGRAGLPGKVNRHFWERFGAAILISTIDGAIQAAVQSKTEGSGTVIYNPSASQDIMTEVLKSTVNIPPTVVKHNGDRIQVLVARDLDFRSVYALRPRN